MLLIHCNTIEKDRREGGFKFKGEEGPMKIKIGTNEKKKRAIGGDSGSPEHGAWASHETRLI